MASVFTLSIEPTEGASFQYGYHLGTIEHVARDCAEDIFRCYTKGGKITIRTVALIRDGSTFDFYDGEWMSDVHAADMAAMEAEWADASAERAAMEDDFYGMHAERARHP